MTAAVVIGQLPNPGHNHPTYKDVWEVPGGTVEPDESPADACTREIKEELGLSVPMGTLLCVDWVPASPPWDGGLMFVFDGGC
ncbi:NUDIX hydrolase [Micromonospora sp. KC723]|uniref:NUDIX domain-containing protein n=1 Tax=Micromonospora sp. KC723 TaxID=2530381 RepID=UPI001FB7A60D|nr:NUDIX hydrolase [Micromonospora sp. KC723]